MNYQPYLISNFNTGFDKEFQPWMNPDDSQEVLFDGYVYRGVWQTRDGYTQYATGGKGGTPLCESRMVNNFSNVSMVGTINGSNKDFTNTLNTPVRRGSILITGNNPSQSYRDDGLGGFPTATAGSIDYNTGVLSITTTVAPNGGSSLNVSYSSHQGFPVMGVMNFYTQDNIRQMITADTVFINRFNNNTNRLDDITTIPLTGDKSNFLSWTNYPDSSNLQRLLYVNYNDQIQQYNGGSPSAYLAYTASNQQNNVTSGIPLGNGTVGPYVINTPTNTGIVPGTLIITDVTGAQIVKDDLFGNLTGAGSGTVNYMTGSISVTFSAVVGNNNVINITYKQLTAPIVSCRHIKNFKDRALLISTIENPGPTKFGLRIRISGTGAFSDVFTSDAIGAGVIDIPSDSFISSCDFNRDTLVIFTEQGTWGMQYTSNDVVPFTLSRFDDSRGSQAPYGTCTYQNRTNAASTRGLVLTDGYSVVRSDGKIPDYSFNEIDQSNFNLCFGGFVDEERDQYLIHPSPGQLMSDRILVSNYEEFNWSVYRLPLSCMGSYISTNNVTWNDLSVYKTWAQMSAVYKTWGSFAFSSGAPFAIGGGHNGQITQLNVTASEDYPVQVRAITTIPERSLQVTTDFQDWQLGDYVYLTGINGMVEANQKQGQITTIVDDNYTFIMDIEDNISNFNTYIDSGTASKVIHFETMTKKFNPFAVSNQKVRCGWVYFYVSTSDTDLTTNEYIVDADNTNPCVITVPDHGYKSGIEVYIDGVQGMTELNAGSYFITVIDENTFSLDDTDATGFGVYTGFGFSSTPTDAVLSVDVIVNDIEDQATQLNGPNSPYQVNLTSQQDSNGVKKWYKIWVNQIGRFIQLKFGNWQAGAEVQIQAIMPGFMGTGRLI